jgi:UDP-GlcNAc:undecaprenyl-phosphate GlcNAc-1-phosphate transferase
MSFTNINFFLIIAVISLNLIIIFNIKKINKIINIWDYPDKNRKIHSKPVALTSFVVIFFNIFLFFIFDLNFGKVSLPLYFKSNNYVQFIVLCISLFFIFLIGVYDDKYNSPPIIRLIALGLIFFILVTVDVNLRINILRFSFTDTVLTLNNLSVLFTLLCMLILLIIMNMFDGINLQASIFYICFFIFLLFNANFDLFISLVILSLVSICFLNKKDIIFLGDCGNYIMSFILSVLLIKTYNLDIYTAKPLYADEIIIYMLFPGLDAIRVIILRLVNGKNPMKADKKHFHHLVINKWGKTKGSFIVYFMTLYSFVVYNFVYEKTLFVLFSFILIYIFIFFFTKNKFLKM